MSLRIKYIVLISLLLFFCISNISGDHHFTENKIKSAFIYNICKFATWPEIEAESLNNLFILGIIGKGSLGENLLSLEGKLLMGRKMIIKKCKIDKFSSGYHALYISPGSKYNTRKILDKLDGKPILTISDSPGFCEMGGMVNLLRINKKIGFEINLTMVKASRINLNSKLLKLALEIY